MWQKKESKLELAASMVRQVMPEFSQKKNVILLCDSWYMKQNLVSIVDEYENLDLIGNARADTVIYDLAPAPAGHRGRPAKHEDFHVLWDTTSGRTCFVAYNFVGDTVLPVFITENRNFFDVGTATLASTQCFPQPFL